MTNKNNREKRIKEKVLERLSREWDEKLKEQERILGEVEKKIEPLKNQLREIEIQLTNFDKKRIEQKKEIENLKEAASTIRNEFLSWLGIFASILAFIIIVAQLIITSRPGYILPLMFGFSGILILFAWLVKNLPTGTPIKSQWFIILIAIVLILLSIILYYSKYFFDAFLGG